MVFHHIILAICWVLYCVLHSVLASLGVKNKLQKTSPKFYRYYRLFYSVFAAVTLFLLIGFQWQLSSPDIFPPTVFSRSVGGLIAIVGLTLMMACIRKYFFSLSGLKNLYQETPSPELMIAGIHRYMRHPLYTGTFLFIWGLWIVFPSAGLLIADVVITGYTLYAIRLEEAKLVAEFGKQYRDYQRAVPKLIPRL
jgi:methanethiol S-methyltransferase